MKKTVLIFISFIIVFVIGCISGFILTMENIKIKTINEQHNIIEIEIFKQTYVFEK